PKSFLARLFTPSTRVVRSTSTSSPTDPESILREILALNARHGHPEVQAYSVPSLPYTPTKKSRSSSARVQPPSSPSPPPKYSKHAPQSPQETFEEIMRLNARHGAPDVQALSVR
ncbi:hypothetical protein JCM6882_005128, partial [Rhodosporidiobolus microsporus]